MSVDVKVRIVDLPWFREVIERLADLIPALADEDLSDATMKRVDLLEKAMRDKERG